MNEKYRILVVEDDSAIRRGIADALRISGYDVLEAGEGGKALRLVVSEEFDMALLDVVLPGADGLTILKEIRKERPSTPVLMLTAKGSEADRIRGLKLGADDYIVKPFSILELLARIEAVLRRSPERPRYQPDMNLPHGKLDLKNRQIIFPDGRTEALTAKEYELIRHLAAHQGRVISKEEILTRVWKLDPRAVDTRSIDTTLARLREKLGHDNAGVIVTLRGRGYAWQDANS